MEDHHAEKENPLLSEEVLADDSAEGHIKRLSRYSLAKTRQKQVADRILSRIIDPVTGETIGDPKGKDGKLHKALEECGSFLLYRHYYELHKYRLLAGCTCKKHLLCALCAIRRAAKCVSIYSEKINQVMAANEFDVIMITWTVKNGPDLAERYGHLQTSAQELLQKRRNALKKNPKTDTLFKHVAGAIYSYEVTVNPESGFHPHIHMIALVPKGMFKTKTMTIKKRQVKVLPDLWAGLVEDWKSITGDSKIVDVRLIENEGDQMYALVETFKYALKMNEMDVDTQLHCYDILAGRRMMGSMGALFGVKLPDNLNDDLLPGEEKFVDIVYQYSGSTFGYQEISRSGQGESKVDASTLGQRFKKKTGRGRKESGLFTESDVNVWLEKKNQPFTKTVDELEWI